MFFREMKKEELSKIWFDQSLLKQKPQTNKQRRHKLFGRNCAVIKYDLISSLWALTTSLMYKDLCDQPNFNLERYLSIHIFHTRDCLNALASFLGDLTQACISPKLGIKNLPKLPAIPGFKFWKKILPLDTLGRGRRQRAVLAQQSEQLCIMHEVCKFIANFHYLWVLHHADWQSSQYYKLILPKYKHCI